MMMISNGKQLLTTTGKPVGNISSQEDPRHDFSSQKFNWLIHLQHVRGEIQSCKELIKQEIERSNNRNEFALYKQGEIQREEGRLQDALESFQACMKLNPGNAENLKEVAKCLYEMRRYKLAADAYSEALHQSKNPDWQTLYFSGMCYLKLGDLAKAKEQAHAAVKAGKHEICYSLLVKILTIEGDLKSAVAVSNAAVDSCPDSVSALTDSGLLLLKAGQTQHAFEKLSSALALDPVYPKALLGIGYITQKHEEFDVALTKYKLAIHYEPDWVALWNNIGLCFHSKEKYVVAISCLKRALWLQPLNWRTLFNLGLSYLAAGQPASAFNFACAAVNLRPDVADCFVLLGAALLELKDPDNAAQALRQAIHLAPEDAVVSLNAALCCLRAGLRDEALEGFEKFQGLTKEAVMRDGGVVPWLSEEVMALAEKLTEALEKETGNEGGSSQKVEVEGQRELEPDEV